tara:strand:- start:565 stop:1536 length:972 start_codon:yes stop_codon:yes gene_type:complete
MLIEKKYKRNKKTGQIVKREKVELICDRCGSKWVTLYQHRKNKVLEGDFCRKCRCKKNIRKQVSLADRRWKKGCSISILLNCQNCDQVIKRTPSHINTNIFCSMQCRDKYLVKIRYGAYENLFNENFNETCYLFGLILGDGHLKKSGRLTTRVSIACDYTGKWDTINSVAKQVLNKLQVSWHEEPKKHGSCAMIGFILPNCLLAKYGLLFHGNKYNAEPCPKEIIVNNINFASGLLNSDGCFSKHTGRKSFYYNFSNIVKSIFCSFKQCLQFNGIECRSYFYKGKFDKRTKKINKSYYVAHVSGENIKILHDKSQFAMKGSLI